MKRAVRAFGWGLLLGLLLAVTGTAWSTGTEGASSSQVDLSLLSDEQVRQLLVEQLQRAAAARENNGQLSAGFVARVGKGLHLLDDEAGGGLRERLTRIGRQAAQLGDDLEWSIRQVAVDSSLATATWNLFVAVALVAAAFLVELLFRLLAGGLGRRLRHRLEPEELKGMVRFWAALLVRLPELVNLVVFVVAALVFFGFSTLGRPDGLRYFFLAVLFLVLSIRLLALFSRLFLAPDLPSLRLLPLATDGAARLHAVILFLGSYTLGGISLLAFFREVGMQPEAVSLLAVFLSTLLLLLIAGTALANRERVRNYLLSDATGAAAGWLSRQLAEIWHVLLFGYLFLVWCFLLYTELSSTVRDNGAFLISLFLVPLFLVMDRIAGWVVRSVVRTLRIYDLPVDEEEEDYQERLAEQERKKNLLVHRLWQVARVGNVLVLAAWMLSLWGYPIPYAGPMVRAAFNILVTLVLALVVWRVASAYIERKIQEATPEEEENEEQDDEWGAAATRGRSYTLLPMVRKFLGTVLIVMVTLIILSSIGVDIGPLLAGAGVVGLAIGFGAQKLVSDVFSGFFYLLDDAFRVGEYLQAGSVSGAVEAITLRNVMLRHHRGMLQIVPYSELGSITNFMRGGIVVKFNLEFPYDTDIDKVRKIIKKVGKAMLEDPEFGKDFIRPVKSQGVREITNSVMVIRVKFTAQPGTHFVIRREAYRRITEALAKQGIHYAHRKVIVELPEEQMANLSPEQRQKVIDAGAAAAEQVMAEEQQANQDSAKEETGMPGM